MDRVTYGANFIFTVLPFSFVSFIFRRVRKIARRTYYLHVRLSAWNNSVPTERILMKLDILAFFFIGLGSFNFF